MTRDERDAFGVQMRNLERAAHTAEHSRRPDRDDIAESCRWAASRLTHYRDQEAAALRAPAVTGADTKDYRRCGYCHTWNTRPCGEQCVWDPNGERFAAAPAPDPFVDSLRSLTFSDLLGSAYARVWAIKARASGATESNPALAEVAGAALADIAAVRVAIAATAVTASVSRDGAVGVLEARETPKERDEARARIEKLRRHSCGSCDLDDDEYREIDGWNKAIDAVMAALEPRP